MRFSWSNLHFTAVTFAASMLALYLAMSIDLQQPYWAMMTVYIISQPMAAAVRSKAVYRLAGTLLGASAAVVMVPRLINTPLLLCLAMALWVGTCLAISLLDRSPRSYLMMLSGYTAAIIGFTGIATPGDIFNLAVLRVQEIALGIVCATVIHSIWFPRPVGHAIRSRFENWLNEADRWALDLLASGDPVACGRDRVRLAAAAGEIHQLATHLPFDTSHLRETTAVVRTLHDRILLLIPLLSSLADRLAALREERRELDGASREAIAGVAAWIGAGAQAAEAEALRDALATSACTLPRDDWYALNRLGLFTRLQEVVAALAEARALLAQLHTPLAPLPAALQQQVNTAASRPLHSDLGMAAISGLAAAIAILITCLVWIGLGWAEGGASAMLAAIICCLFAAMDDPTPALKIFGFTALAAFPLSGFYLFFVFPSIDSFPLLVLTLAPTLIGIGTIALDPRYAGSAMMTLLAFCNTMAIQERVNTDFANFVNFNLSQFFGVFTAIYVIRSIRVMSADTSARRLLSHTWKNIARLAQGRGDAEPAVFASRMVDRLSLLVPRLAASRADDLSGVDALAELRIGMDVVALQNLRGELPADARAPVDALLDALAEHYARHSAGEAVGDNLRLRLDQALQALAPALPAEANPALAALVGLRRNLFPQAPYTPCPTGSLAS